MCHPSFCSISWNLRVQIRSPFLNQGTQGYIGTHIIDTNALLELPNDAKNTGWLSWPRLGYNGTTNSCKKVPAYLQYYSRCTKLHLHKKELESIWSIQLLGPERERELCTEGTLQNVSGFWVQYTQYFVHCTKTKKKHAYILVAQKHLGYPAIRREDPKHVPAWTTKWLDTQLCTPFPATWSHLHTAHNICTAHSNASIAHFLAQLTWAYPSLNLCRVIAAGFKPVLKSFNEW